MENNEKAKQKDNINIKNEYFNFKIKEATPPKDFETKYLNVDYSHIEKHKMYVHLIAGAGSKLIESAIMFPLDTVKTRLQFQGDFSKGSVLNRYSGTVNAFITTFRSEGLRSLFKGYIPHTLYVLPSSAISFFLFESVVKEAKKSKRYKNMMFDTSGIKAISETKQLIAQEQIPVPSRFGVILPIVAMTIARITGSVLRTPFDLIKMRQQVSGSLVNEKVKRTNSSALKSVLKIIKSDGGIKGLFKYSYVTLLRDLPFTAIYFTTYEFSRNYQKSLLNRGDKKKKLTSINNLISGGIAGCLGTTFTIPVDVIKTNLQTQGLLPKEKRVFTGVISAFKYIVKHEGFKGLTKGLGTRLIHVIPSSAISFCSYEYLKKLLM